MSERPAGARNCLAVLLGITVLALPPAAIGAEPPLAAAHCVPPGVWVEPTAAGPRAVGADPLLAAAARRPVVLLGERHDSAAHHRWQLATLEALHARRPRMLLGLEMVPRRLQPVLDRWVAGHLEESTFLAAVEWERVWGFDPNLYLPILRFARARRLPLLALNVDRDTVRRVRAVGFDAVPPEQREGVGRPAPPTPAYRDQLQAAWLAHRPSGTGGASADAPGLDDPAFRRFVESQQLWDRAMAEAIAAAHRRQPDALVVALIGSGHLAGGGGVPHQLRALGMGEGAWFLPWDSGLDCRGLTPGLATAVFGIGAEASPPSQPGEGTAPPPGTRLGIYLVTHGGEVRIERVAPGSLAAAADLRVGDRIVAIAGTAATSAREVIERVRRQPAGTPLRLQLRRNGRPLERTLTFP
jgi:hypothetical protein